LSPTQKRCLVRKTITILSASVFVVTVIVGAVLGVHFDQNIGGHLKRAADANSIELAKQELKTALDNIERSGLTSGYTSVLWRTPDEDIGFWYNNIKASYAELNSLSPDASQLERSNTLIKLRETLLDHSGGDEVVTAPDGISRYPNNAIFATVFLFSGLLAIGGLIAILVTL
jgi:hypothetical protein